MMLYSIVSKLIKPLVGSGIGNIRLAADIYQRIMLRVLPESSKLITINGLKMKVLSEGHIEDISTELLFKGVHEPMTTKVFKKVLKPGDAVIDVGANVGYFTLLSSKLVGWRGIVHAFEPSPSNMNTLIHNIKLNKLENIQLYEIAASNKTGRMTFYTSSTESARHSLIQTKEHDNNITVEVNKLDDVLGGHFNVNLLKTDTEGNELAVLQGAEKIITNSQDIILIVEINFAALEACNTQLGTIWRYLINDLKMKYTYLVNDYKNTIELINESDAIHFALDNLKSRNKKELGYNLLCSRNEIKL
jgi:FkbM family methyltransferase